MMVICSRYYSVYIPYKNLNTEVKSPWYQYGLEWHIIITQVKKDSLTLDIPTKYQYLTSITISIPMDKFFDTIIDVDY